MTLAPAVRSRPQSRNPLLLHDLAISLTFLRHLFAKPIDGFSALFLLIFLVAFARDGLSTLQPLYRAVFISTAPAILAVFVYAVLRLRLLYLRSESVIAAAALNASCAHAYLFVVQLAASTVFSIALFAPNPLATVQSIASWWASVIASAFVARAVHGVLNAFGDRGVRHISHLSDSRYSARIRAISIFTVCLIIAATSLVFASNTVTAVASVLALAWGLWFTPVSYPVIEFEGLTGRTLAFSAWSRLHQLLVATLAFAGAGLVGLDWRVPAAITITSLILIIYKWLEILLVRAVGRRRVQFALAICIFALFAAVLVLPALIALMLPALVAWLLRVGTTRIWLVS